MRYLRSCFKDCTRDPRFAADLIGLCGHKSCLLKGRIGLPSTLLAMDARLLAQRKYCFAKDMRLAASMLCPTTPYVKIHLHAKLP